MFRNNIERGRLVRLDTKERHTKYKLNTNENKVRSWGRVGWGMSIAISISSGSSNDFGTHGKDDDYEEKGINRVEQGDNFVLFLFFCLFVLI